MKSLSFRPIRLALVVLVSVAAVGLAQEGPGEPFESRAGEWQDLYNAGDMQALVDALYTEDARLFTYEGEVLEGREALATHFGSFMEAGLTSADVVSHETGAGADWGYDTGSYTFSTDEGQVAAAGEFLTLTRWDGDRWRIFLHFPRTLPPAPAEGDTAD